MPSFSVHLACANEYLKKHDISDRDSFLKGVISVDLAQDKYKSHYSNTSDTSDLKTYLSNKVNVERYLSENLVRSDFDKGYLLHLLTDYYFYTKFFSEEFISKLTYTEFKKIIYHDYSSINKYITKKYDVIYTDEIKMYEDDNRETPIVLFPDLLDKFIEEVSSLDLDDFIKTNKKTN